MLARIRAACSLKNKTPTGSERGIDSLTLRRTQESKFPTANKKLEMQYEQEAEQLKKSAWPKCDQIAEGLAALGPGAIQALQHASKSRTHHVRSACLRAVNSIDATRGNEMAKAMLNDRAYEVRETAAKILGVPIPGLANA